MAVDHSEGPLVEAGLGRIHTGVRSAGAERLLAALLKTG
jgi:hypothetical protein